MSKEVSAIIFGNQDQLVSCISCNFSLTEQIYLGKLKRYTIMFCLFLTIQIAVITLIYWYKTKKLSKI